MKNYRTLDSVFAALANKHRREIIYAVSLQPYAISQLATMQHLSLPAIHKHIKILELAHMITRKKTGQTNFLTLNKASFQTLQHWLLQFHAYWGNDNETYGNYTAFFDKKL